MRRFCIYKDMTDGEKILQKLIAPHPGNLDALESLVQQVLGKD